MKRFICGLLVLLLLTGCGRKVVAPSTKTASVTVQPVMTVLSTSTPVADTAAPAPTGTPRPALPTCEPLGTAEALFPEELLSSEGDPVASEIRSLLTASGLTKDAFLDRLEGIVLQADTIGVSVRRLSDEGRGLTAERKETTANALQELMGDETLADLEDAYSRCTGEGKALPISEFRASIDALSRAVREMEDRTVPFFSLDDRVAREYITVLGRFMGEQVKPDAVFAALEELAETEAYAIQAALQADPEAGRKKVSISYGSFDQNMSFLRTVAGDICPLADESALLVPYHMGSGEKMELLEMAFRYCPGLVYLQAYAAQTTEEQQARWANAPTGYLKGLAMHNSYAVIPYMEEFGLEYLQYRWYEEMLSVTMTGISALLIHYYGYTQKDLAAYLQDWGAKDFAEYLYGKAMDDPFDSLITAYGYWQYLDICQAALDAGCDSELTFLRDYLSVGPAPFDALKEYMVSLYQNKVDKASDGE